MKLVVVAAWEPELERFRMLSSIAAEGGASLVDAAEPIGIGPIDAAIGATRCIQRLRPRHLLLLGTAGAATTSTLALHDVVVASAVRLVDPAVVEARAAMPYEAEVALEGPLLDAFVSAGARAVVVGNTLSVTTDDRLAAGLAGVCEVEHLEAYAVARACAAAADPCSCTVVLGIANRVGSTGRDEWRANHESASARVADVAARALALLRTSTTTRSPA